jgi:hypothetical protein
MRGAIRTEAERHRHIDAVATSGRVAPGRKSKGYGLDLSRGALRPGDCTTLLRRVAQRRQTLRDAGAAPFRAAATRHTSHRARIGRIVLASRQTLQWSHVPAAAMAGTHGGQAL